MGNVSPDNCCKCALLVFVSATSFIVQAQGTRQMHNVAFYADASAVRGVYPILTTPYLADGAVDYGSPK
jgi:hypothetical protein